MNHDYIGFFVLAFSELFPSSQPANKFNKQAARQFIQVNALLKQISHQRMHENINVHEIDEFSCCRSYKLLREILNFADL